MAKWNSQVFQAMLTLDGVQQCTMLARHKKSYSRAGSFDKTIFKQIAQFVINIVSFFKGTYFEP